MCPCIGSSRVERLYSIRSSLQQDSAGRGYIRSTDHNRVPHLLRPFAQQASRHVRVPQENLVDFGSSPIRPLETHCLKILDFRSEPQPT